MSISGMGSIGSWSGGNSMGQTPVGGGSTGGQGGMGGGLWGMVASYAMQELDREKQDRSALFQGLKQAMNPNDYIMAHYPNFYSTPQVQTSAVANPTPNAPSQQAVNMSPMLQGMQKNYSPESLAGANKANSEAEFYKYLMDKNKGISGGSSSGSLLDRYKNQYGLE